jgi:hypothetical protein
MNKVKKILEGTLYILDVIIELNLKKWNKKIDEEDNWGTRRGTGGTRRNLK